MDDHRPDALTCSADAEAKNEAKEWIVRLERRDCECQFRFIDRHGNVNSRLSSAQHFPRDVAEGYAKAITEGHPKYKAKAMLYSKMRNKREPVK